MKVPNSLVQLIRELSRLPGIGPKSAQKLAFYLFEQPKEDIERLVNTLLEAKQDLHLCVRCYNVTDLELCEVCADPKRDTAQICVVEEPGDLIALERSGEYGGLYHVLHGRLDPMNGISQDRLYIAPLLERLRDAPRDTEIILATSTTVEGEATSLYLERLLAPLNLHLSRIAYGLPVGGALEYADEVTLGRAMTGRHRLGRAPVRDDSEPGEAGLPVARG